MLTFTKSMLALSVMAAVAGANAATYTEDTTLTDKIFTEGIMAINGATVTVTGDEIGLFRLFGETGSSMVPWSRSELAREKDAAKFPS